MNFIKKIIINNSGVSVKNFAVFIAALIALMHVVAVWVLIFLSFFLEKDIQISLTNVSVLLATIEVILLALMSVKVWSEKYEKTPAGRKISRG